MSVDVSALRIHTFPDPVLRERAKPIKEVTTQVRAVAARMLELMREAQGIGLAAPQVGLPWRLFIADVPESDDRTADGPEPSATRGPVYYINPVLSGPDGGVEPFEEGCLSLPDIRGDVLRPPAITITAIDLDGRPFTHRASGLLARCWQHELDHLDGVLIIDRMTQASRLKNRAALRAMEKDAL